MDTVKEYVKAVVDKLTFEKRVCRVTNHIHNDLNVTSIFFALDRTKVDVEQEAKKIDAILTEHLFELYHVTDIGMDYSRIYLCSISKIKEFIRIESLKEILN